MVPKYVPDYEDLWDITLCAICGSDVLEFGADTCSARCQWRLDAWQREQEEIDQWHLSLWADECEDAFYEGEE